MERFLASIILTASLVPASGVNFTAGSASALRFGTHEIVLTGNGAVANPFDTIASVRFTPPSGSANAVVVHAFFDRTNTWRARLYVTETGRWEWASSCASGAIAGGSERELVAPWKGQDVVLRLVSQNAK